MFVHRDSLCLCRLASGSCPKNLTRDPALLRRTKVGADIVLTVDGELRKNTAVPVARAAEWVSAIGDTRTMFEGKGWGMTEPAQIPPACRFPVGDPRVQSPCRNPDWSRQADVFCVPRQGEIVFVHGRAADRTCGVLRRSRVCLHLLDFLAYGRYASTARNPARSLTRGRCSEAKGWA
jgi:hypothetical protein